MDDADILKVVRRVIAAELEVPIGELRDAGSLRSDYNLDSVAAVSIVFELEGELGVEIDVRQIAHVDSIDDLKRLLAEGVLARAET